MDKHYFDHQHLKTAKPKQQRLPRSVWDYLTPEEISLEEILDRLRKLYWVALVRLCRGLSPRDPRLKNHKYREYFQTEVLQCVLGEGEAIGNTCTKATKEVVPESSPNYIVTVINHYTEEQRRSPFKRIKLSGKADLGNRLGTHNTENPCQIETIISQHR